MKVLIIPSWFPNKREKNLGNFIKNQVEALAKIEDLEIAVLDMQFFSLGKPISTINNCFISEEIVKEKGYIHFKFNFIKLFSKKRDKYNKRYRARIFYAYKKVLKYFGVPDIIHGHVTYPAGYGAYLIGKEYKIPYIITEHASFYGSKFMNDSYIKFTKPVLENAEKIIAVSSFLKDIINEFSSRVVYKEEIEIINNVINISKIYSEIPKIKKDKIVLLNIGRMIELKGIRDLLKSIDILVNKRGMKNIELNLVGPCSNKKRKEWIKLIKSLKIEQYVNLKKELPYYKVFEEINKSDILVISSKFETFGMTGIEAMACGKPVVSTDCGGVSEYIRSFNGIIVQKENPLSLADGIEKMILEYNNYDSVKIKDFVENKFGEDVFIEKTLNIYTSILNNKS